VAEEVAWLVRSAADGDAWRLAGWLFVPAVMIVALLKWPPSRWPFQRWRDVQAGAGAGTVVALLILGALAVNFRSDGDPAPLPYVPLLNPLDLTFAAIALAAVLWWREARRLDVVPNVPDGVLPGAAAIAAFLWLTLTTVRVVHHYADVPFDERAWHSGVLQASLALVWTTAALATMVFANRRDARLPWLGGAALLALVVVKLFLVDLAQAGTVARIVSFIGVGLLLLLIGYLAPVPSRRAADAT
jgi:uncharacterized membrane protein